MEKTPVFNIGPIYFDTTVLIMTVLTCVIVFGLVFWASRNMKVKPTGKQNVLEWVVEFINGIAKDNLGSTEANSYTLLGFTLFGFLLVANCIGLITKIESPTGLDLWSSPTANVAVDLTLAMLVTVLANVQGVRKFGFLGYFKNAFLTPAAMTPMNILEEFTNFLSLGLRLYGNIFAGEVMLGLLASMGNSHVWALPFAIIIEVLWTAFSLFISALQAYVFVLLTMLYVSHKVLDEE